MEMPGAPNARLASVCYVGVWGVVAVASGAAVMELFVDVVVE